MYRRPILSLPNTSSWLPLRHVPRSVVVLIVILRSLQTFLFDRETLCRSCPLKRASSGRRLKSYLYCWHTTHARRAAQNDSSTQPTLELVTNDGGALARKASSGQHLSAEQLADVGFTNGRTPVPVLAATSELTGMSSGFFGRNLAPFSHFLACGHLAWTEPSVFLLVVWLL